MLTEQAVVGAEVMTPLRDAVGLVDGDEAGLAFGEHLRKAGNAKALGSDEEKLERAGKIGAAGFASGLARQAGVDAGNVEAEGGELGCLVVHKRDQRRNNERRTAAGERGKLVAEGFAGAGRHDEQDVAALDRGTADGFLVGAKSAETEALLKESVKR